MGVLDRIKEALGGRSSVQTVADDENLMAELLLLVRLMFADGVLVGEERGVFDAILERDFGIPAEDVPEVMKFLVEFGYETTARQAADTFRTAPIERRETLLRHMIAIARADTRLHPQEVGLLERTAAHLDIPAVRLSEIAAEPGHTS